jgi:hypothetical protein
MSTLAVVEVVLRRAGEPLTVAEIIRRAGSRLPTRAKVPASVVARDLALDLKRKGEDSTFVRVALGRYTLRELAPDVESLVIDQSRRRWTWTDQARQQEVLRRREELHRLKRREVVRRVLRQAASVDERQQ